MTLTSLFALLLAGCPAEDAPSEDSAAPVEPGFFVRLTSPDPTAAVDECAETCFSVVATLDGAPAVGAVVDVWVGADCVGADLVTGADGTVTACTSGLPVGTWEVIATAEHGAERAEGVSTLDVRPFGWADGFTRDATVVAALPWTPTFTRYSGNPVLPPGEAGAFDSVGTMVPSVARSDDGWVMWYAGTAEEDYLVGWATSPDGHAWARGGSTAALANDDVDGSWKRYSTNSPMVVQDGDTWNVFYTGRAEETGNLTIGLATGASATDVEDIPDNPVFSWNDEESSWAGQAAAHPAVLRNPAGWWELWYSTGYHKIGYAYSPDGRSWNRYCHNPIFTGDGANPWESNQVKAAEVILHDGWYMMTYTGGATGAFRVGWAMSRDGLHWVRAAEPVLSPPEEAGTWESSSVLSAAIAVDGDQLRMWYAGTGQSGSAIGAADAPLPTTIPEAR
jgi:predicted GH43/DUF377 family glycosyl hydrolase